MSARVDRLRERLEEPLLVVNPTNINYLVGFKSSNAALLVEPERLRLFSDFRYAEAARVVEGVEFTQVKRALLADVGNQLRGRVAFESGFVTYAGYEELRGGAAELVPRDGLVESLRMVKEEQEVAVIQRACAVTDRVYERLADERFTGRTERDLAWTIEELFHEEGADSVTFETIVASGPNAAKPHTRPGDREIGRGETVVIDAGCTVDDYTSDYTRTFATGPLPDELKRAYEVCAAAQEAALHGLHAGLTGVEADALARDVIEESGLGELFGHGLGHGIGLGLHEGPRMSPESPHSLEPGNVVTVEPGIYLPGLGGIRIEDDVVITTEGIENLTNVRKDLITVD